MGFGLGFDAPPRRGPFAVTRDATWEVVPFSITPAVLPRLQVVTPDDAPPRVELDRVSTASARWSHARKLVTRRVVSDPHRLYAQRSEVGDARDLFCHVLAHSFSAPDGAVFSTGDVTRPRFRSVDHFVHVGDTAFAREMLRRMTDGAMPSTSNEARFNGELDTLDGDGYVWLCVRRRGGRETHLMLVGGSGYGTHHAVTDFLRKYLGAEWLFPGANGESIETRSVLDTQEVVRHIEEPTVRSRAHGLFLDGSISVGQIQESINPNPFEVSAAEADEMRSWLLRNRMRSNNLRPLLVPVFAVSRSAGWPDDFTCQRATDPDDEAFYLGLLRSEERVPVEQALSQHLSPFATSLAPSDPTVPRMQDPEAVRCYPDLRPRDPSFDAPAWLPRGVGDPLDTQIAPVATEIPYSSRDEFCAPAHRGRHDVLVGRSNPQRVEVLPVPTPDGRMGPPTLESNLLELSTNLAYDAFTTVLFERTTRRRRFWRFIPSALVERVDGPHWVNSGWSPCIFRFVEGGPGRGLYLVHASMAADIAAQVALEMEHAPTSAFGAGDAAHTLAHDDGSKWCRCDACTLADDTGGGLTNSAIDGDPLLLRCGDVISRSRASFERESISGPGSARLPPSNWEANPVGFYHRSMTLDELCMRGVVYHTGYLQKYSRRVIALASAVSERLAEHFRASPEEFARSRVVATLAYQNYAASPIFSGPIAASHETPRVAPDLDLPKLPPGGPAPADTSIVKSSAMWGASLANPLVKSAPPAKTSPIVTKDLSPFADGATDGTNKAGSGVSGDPPLMGPLSGTDPDPRVPGVVTTDATLSERLPPAVVVYIAESRDTEEYNLPYPAVEPGTIAFAAERMQQFPQQFNHERWSVAASRTGMYEYIQARQFVVPRIYTNKLQRAVKNAVDRFQLRGFISEACGAAGVTGPMLWELARVLWNPDERLGDMREVWCRAAFGPAAEPMQEYFDMAEHVWSDTRGREPDYARPGTTKPDRRVHSGEANGFFGQGYGGRLAEISQFAGLMRMSSDGSTRVHERLWAKLNDAVGIAGLTPAQLERVQLFRRTFGFTELVARWYGPLYDAFEMIRKANRASVAHTSIEGVAELGNLVSYDLRDLVMPMSPLLPMAALAPLDPDSIRKVRACIGTPRESGIRNLRLLVHRYFAQQDLAFDWTGTIPSLGSRTALDPSGVGFGLFAGLERVGTLLEPRFGAPISENAHRQVGLYTPDVLQYAGWWNSTFLITDESIPEATRVVNSIEEHNGKVPKLDEPTNLGWLFCEIKKMARAVAIYSTGVITSEPGRTNSDVAQSIHGG